METKINYTAVGIFVIVLVAISVYFAYWISNRGDKNQYTTYVVQFSEPVSGLTTNSTVTFNGVSVGRVDAIVINPQNPRQVNTYLSVLRNTPLNSSATARLRSQGITGVAYIDLNITEIDAPRLTIEPGNTYPKIIASPSLFTTLETVFEKMSTSIEDVSEKLDLLFDDKTITELNNIIDNMEHSSNILAQRILPNVDKITGRIEQVTINLQQLSDDLRRNPTSILYGKPSILGPGE